ncbi:hypothetical protein B0H13DRAFT_1887966 [Mycena leptocephala]|nr:hypothetical protein B0H13DRAFT_1887966 [Mycena leptocephala]
MKKVLQNSVNKLKADNRAEALAEEEDRDEDPPIANGKKRKSSERVSDSESEDEEEEDHDPQADSNDSSDEEEEVSRKGKPQKQSKRSSIQAPAAKNNASTGNKRKIPSTQDDEIERPPKKAKKSGSIPSPPLTQRSKSRPTKAPLSKIPETCPNYGCDHSLPEGDLSANLQGLFIKRQNLLSTPNPNARRLEQIEQEICTHIAHENEIIRLENLGDTRDWPSSSLNYASLIKRIFPLKAQLLDLVRDDYDLYNCIVWTNFLEVIDYNVHAFGRSEDPATTYTYAVLRARCGYLGPQGALIIGSIIDKMFANSRAELESTLSDTVQRLVDDRPQDFDLPDPFNHPLYLLSLDSFIKFVLVPHVAARMIEEDMNVQYMDAVDIQDESAEYGDMFHWEVDCPMLLAALKKYSRSLLNVSASAQEPSPPRKKNDHPNSPSLPPAHCKKQQTTPGSSGGRRIEETELTLEDFPAISQKKPPKEPVLEAVANDSRTEPRYGTRSSTKGR